MSPGGHKLNHVSLGEGPWSKANHGGMSQCCSKAHFFMGHVARGGARALPTKKHVSQGLLNPFTSYGTHQMARVAASSLSQPMRDGDGLRLSRCGHEHSRMTKEGLVRQQG